MKIMVMLSNVSRALFIILVFACHCAGNLADDGSWTEMYDENGVTRTFKSVQDMIKSDDYTDHEEITAEQELYRNETVILNSDIDSYSTKLMSDIGAYTSIIDAFMKDTQELEDRRSIIDENTIEVKKSLLHERNAVERLGENIS